MQTYSITMVKGYDEWKSELLDHIRSEIGVVTTQQRAFVSTERVRVLKSFYQTLITAGFNLLQLIQF